MPCLRLFATALLLLPLAAACTPDDAPNVPGSPPTTAEADEGRTDEANARGDEGAAPEGSGETPQEGETTANDAHHGDATAATEADPASAERAGPNPDAAAATPPDGRYNVGGNQPLNPATRSLVWGTPEDAHPERLDASREDLVDRHYLYSDEEHLALYYEHLRDRGGVYMGVGTDQLYLFAGWMRPSLAFATDYDPWVRELHFIYLTAFERADTIDDFLAFWRADAFDDTRALLRTRWADHPQLDLMLEVHRTAHRLVLRRMARIRRMATEYEIPTFVSDEATYAFVRDMARGGRIRPAVINLLDDTGLASLAAMIRELGLTVRGLYVSNAEEYWGYRQGFRDNVRAQPTDERSWLIRTSASKPANNDYRYYLQPLRDFQDQLGRPEIRSHRDVYTRDSVRDETHIPFRILDGSPRARR